MALAAAAGSKNGPPITGRCAADAADFFAARGFLTREAFHILRNAEFSVSSWDAQALVWAPRLLRCRLCTYEGLAMVFITLGLLYRRILPIYRRQRRDEMLRHCCFSGFPYIVSHIICIEMRYLRECRYEGRGSRQGSRSMPSGCGT